MAIFFSGFKRFDPEFTGLSQVPDLKIGVRWITTDREWPKLRWQVACVIFDITNHKITRQFRTS